MVYTVDSQTLMRIYRPRLERGIGLVDLCFDTLFDRAPVMMQSIDEYWRLVRVNRMWLQTMGYDNQEVLGRCSVDFLTEQSRTWAVNDTLPLFWRTGSARSVGYEMVRKDGRVMNVLMDSVLETDEAGIRHGFTTIRSAYDLVLWKHSLTMLATLTSLGRLRRAMETFLTLDDPDLILGSAGPGDSAEPAGVLPGQDPVLDLMVAVHGVSKIMGSLGSVLAESARTAGNQQQNLVELAEAVTIFCGKLPWLTGTQPTAEG